MNDADIERLINEARSKGILQAKWVDDALPLLPPTSCPCEWCADRLAGKQMVPTALGDDWPTFDFGAAVREGVLSGSRPDPDSQAAIKRVTERLISREAYETMGPAVSAAQAEERFGWFLPEEWVRKQVGPDAGSLAAASAMADAPQTITRAAEDMSFIAKRAKEIEEDRIQSLRNRDPEVAGAEHLDRIADDYGEKRQGVESDYTFRQRLLKKIRARRDA